ncbi:hypothetical protein [Roseobacter denitrificans]|uniref:hypothetical protein n=1 Tax=Roseobacter denitrificans TaxID=2434 RepID=UPI0002FA773B|nr:hypothetical protein [Roseobacter denitrificans]
MENLDQEVGLTGKRVDNAHGAVCNAVIVGKLDNACCEQHFSPLSNRGSFRAGRFAIVTGDPQVSTAAMMGAKRQFLRLCMTRSPAE